MSALFSYIVRKGFFMILTKENISLYYEVQGEGEPLMLIHGAVVDSWLYENTAKLLAKHFTVITYDRRGSSRSTVEGEASYDLEAQSEDVKAILDALDITQVTIAGASAGGIIGHYFMIKYPERVKKLIMYEPPLLALTMKDENSQKEWVDMMKDYITRGKLNKALYEFALSIGSTDTRAPQKPEDVAKREMANFYHFLQHEFDVFIDYFPDVEKSKELSEKLIIAVGESSGDAPYPTAAKKFAKLLDKQVLYYPGYHNLPSDMPKEFAICVMGTLML